MRFFTMSKSLLINLIQQTILKNNGIISFAEYMGLVLYHLDGYYNSPQFTIGKDGDFTTAPHISPLFAQCFANQCLTLFNQLDQGDILECGAGTGQFACDLLLALDQLGCPPEHYYIYEICPRLREKQAAFIKTTCPLLFERVKWLTDLPNKISGIVIANEVLDALPTHCFAVHQGTIKERAVTLQGEQFAWQLSAPLSDAFVEQARLLHQRLVFAENYQSEINLAVLQFVKTLTSRLVQGVIFFVDYGYGEREFYHPLRNQGTLTCFHQHQSHADPFQFVGEQDITSHVNFTQVIEEAAKEGCELAGFTSQAAFLLGSDLIKLASKMEQNLSAKEAVNFHRAIKQLTFPTEMGERIKVMALSKHKKVNLMGFEQDRSREL